MARERGCKWKVHDEEPIYTAKTADALVDKFHKSRDTRDDLSRE
jgi:hypothetical protein